MNEAVERRIPPQYAKTQFFLTGIDRDLLISALEFWRSRIDNPQEMTYAAHRKAGEFCKRRIDELKARLAAPDIKHAA